MAASKTELWTQLANAIKILDELWKFGGNNVTNIIGLQDILVQSFNGNHASTTSASVAALRDSISTLSIDTTLLDSLILELASNGYSSLATDIDNALEDIAFAMDGLSETVLERNITYGSLVTGGSNVGDGILYRLITDQFANKIETMTFDGGTTRGTIQTDKNTGATSGTESMLLFGDGRQKVDELDLGDTPEGSITITAKRSDDGILTNGGFETSSGTAPTIVFTGWTPSVQANIDEETTTFHRGAKSINFIDNVEIEQHIVTAASSIDITKPVFLIVRFQRQLSCDGTLTIRLGSQTESVVLAAQTGWNDLYLGIDNEKGWYDVFKEDDSSLGARVNIALSGRTTGNLLIDEVILAQPDQFDGKWYLLTAGEADFINGDTFSFVDSVNGTAGGDGRIQFTMSRLYQKYLPHTSGVPTYADA